VAKIRSRISGQSVFTPNAQYRAARSNVQRGEDEVAENWKGVTPQTPCRAKFLAIAM
jgi:hypothetical protein